MRNRFRVLTGATASALFLAGMLMITILAAGQAPAPAYKAPRLKGTTNPNLSGLWQALNEGNWDIQAHAAQPGPPQFGALFAQRVAEDKPRKGHGGSRITRSREMAREVSFAGAIWQKRRIKWSAKLSPLAAVRADSRSSSRRGNEANFAIKPIPPRYFGGYARSD